MSSIDVVLLDEESSLEDAPSAGGGPPGPPPGGGPPAPPGPLAKAALKTPCSSVAWSLVSLPLETSPAIRSSIFDLSWSGEGRVPTRLHRGIDIGQGRRQGVLVRRTDGAGIDFREQLILQLLQWRLTGIAGGRRDRGHDSSKGSSGDSSR
jgi:hypothetical protein